MKLRITRTVTTQECSWLHRDYKKGETVDKYSGHTYGVIGPNGIPIVGEDITFIEFPKDALEVIK